MRLELHKNVFAILLTVLNLDLRSCSAYGLENPSFIDHKDEIGPRSKHHVSAEEHFAHTRPNYFDLKLATTRLTKNPPVQFTLNGSKKGTVKGGDENNRADTNPVDNLNNGQYTLLRRTFNRIGQRFGNRNNSFDDNPKRKSELECERYGRAVGRKVSAPLPLVGAHREGNPANNQGSTCDGLHTPLIVSGKKTQPGEFSHMAALGWFTDGKVEYRCGGSLISERWILTAAHCTQGRSGSPSVVRLGAHILSDTSVGRIYEIRSIWSHPNYKPPAMYADIALLELSESVTFTDLIKPACLYQEFDTTPLQAWVSGWGVTQIGDESSDTLLKARLYIIDSVTCAHKYNQSAAVPRGVVPSMVCAGDTKGGWQSDTCQGDSGGPLQVIHPTITCLYQVVGITSFGKLCALRDSPGVYTRVSQYLDWIEGIVWP